MNDQSSLWFDLQIICILCFFHHGIKFRSSFVKIFINLLPTSAILPRSLLRVGSGAIIAYFVVFLARLPELRLAHWIYWGVLGAFLALDFSPDLMLPQHHILCFRLRLHLFLLTDCQGVKLRFFRVLLDYVPVKAIVLAALWCGQIFLGRQVLLLLDLGQDGFVIVLQG